MPRQQKRKAGEIDYDDPLAFVSEYCRKRSISYQIGQSHAEKDCIRRADEAREDFKSRRDAAGPVAGGDAQSGASDEHDRKGLSPAQKYMIRLQNNRKSANASKVFNEVLKREQAACLEKLSIIQAAKEPKKCTRCRELLSPEKVAALQAEVEKLTNLLREERAENERMRKAVISAREPATQVDMHGPTRQSSQDMPNHANSSSSSRHEIPSPKRVSPSQKPVAAKPEQVLDVYRQTSDAQHISTGTIDESQQEHLPPMSSSQENIPRLHAQKNSHHPYSMSLSQSDMKELQVGVNLSQSQTEHPEELDEKGQLTRNMPRSGGIPVAMLDSQPSQSDVPAIKYSIGSDELNFPSSDCIGSQGTVDGGTPKKARLE